MHPSACLRMITLLSTVFCCSSIVVAKQPPSSGEVVARLANLRHGLRDLPPEEKALLDDVRKNPASYAEAVAEAAKLPESIAELPQYYELRKVGGALGLARELGLEHGGPIARQVFSDSYRLLQEYRKREPSSEPVRQDETERYVEALVGSALDVMGRLGDHVLAPRIVDVLAGDDKLLEPSILEYLEKIAPLRSDIRPKLEEMYNSETSPLRNNPQLLRVLKAIDAAEKEKKLDRKKDAESDSEGERNP